MSVKINFQDIPKDLYLNIISSISFIDIITLSHIDKNMNKYLKNNKNLYTLLQLKRIENYRNEQKLYPDILHNLLSLHNLLIIDDYKYLIPNGIYLAITLNHFELIKLYLQLCSYDEKKACIKVAAEMYTTEMFEFLLKNVDFDQEFLTEIFNFIASDSSVIQGPDDSALSSINKKNRIHKIVRKIPKVKYLFYKQFNIFIPI